MSIKLPSVVHGTDLYFPSPSLHACPHHQVETGPRLCNLPKILGNYMPPLPSQVMLVVEHRRIRRQQQPSLTEYMLIDLKLFSYHRFCLLLFLIDGGCFLHPNHFLTMANKRRSSVPILIGGHWPIYTFFTSLVMDWMYILPDDPWTLICISSLACVPYSF